MKYDSKDHAVCDKCWEKGSPGIEPWRIDSPPLAQCHYCGDWTTSVIFMPDMGMTNEQLGELLDIVKEVLLIVNPLLDEMICLDECQHGGLCIMAAGHKGAHDRSCSRD